MADVTISRNAIRNNGGTVAGGGVILDTRQSSSIATQNITIADNHFEDNASAAVRTFTATNLAKVAIGTNTYTGALQKMSLDDNTQLLIGGKRSQPRRHD